MTTGREQLQALALAVVLAIGAGLLWGVAVALSYAIINESFLSPDVRLEQLNILDDGTVVMGSYSRLGHWVYRKLDGTSIKDKPSFGGAAYLYGPANRSQPDSDLTWNARITRVYDRQDNGDEAWYYVHDGKRNGHTYLVGYDGKTKLKIGYIGRNGFQPDEPRCDDQFPVSRRMMSGQTFSYLPFSADAKQHHDPDSAYPSYPCIVTDDGLLRIDLRRKAVSFLWKGENLISVTAWHSPARTSGSRWDAILVRTPDSVLVLNPSGKQEDDYPLPPELRNANILWHNAGKNRAVVIKMSDTKEWFWIDGKSKTIRREHIDFDQTQADFAARKAFENRVLPGIAMPSPGAFTLFAVWCLSVDEVSAPMRDPWVRLWPSVLLASVVSGILAVFCYRRQRKAGLPWTGVWTGFVLLFGLPAYFGYLAHRFWPARLACPHCGRRVPRDRLACFACNRDFPPPPPKGIEVFA